MGVVVDLPKGITPDRVREVRLFELTEDGLRRLLDPVQVHTFSFYAASVFDLQPDTAYRFRASVIGSDGKTLHEETIVGRTRKELSEPPAALKEIHVSREGDDGNDGTSQSSKRTIRAAVKAARRPGTHVVIHAGTYYEGNLGALGSGTAEAPIVVRAARGEKVVIDGSHLPALRGGWKDLGDGYFSTPFEGKTWVTCAENTATGEVRRLYALGRLADLKAKKAGRYDLRQFNVTEAFHCTGKEIVIYCPPFKSGSDVRIHVSARDGAFELSRNRHVVFGDLTFQYFHGQTCYVNDSSDVTFRRCEFRYCTLPLALKRASHRLLVEHCRFVDDCTRWGFLPKTGEGGDFGGHIETGAIYTHYPYDGRGLVFRNNVINGLFDGINLTPYGRAPAVKTSETDFYRNTIVKVCDDLIEADGFSRNVRIFDNRMENYLSGISIAQGYHGPTYVLRNILGGAGNSTAVTCPPHYEGYPVKTNGGAKHGTTGWAFFFHNTCYTTVPKTNAFRVQVAKWRKLVFANNIWQGTRDGFVYWRSEYSPIEMTSDMVYPQTGSLLKVKSKHYDTKAEAAQVRPFLAGAIVKDPRLVDPGSGDYRLSPDSPAVDAGTVVPGINDKQHRGKAPDIGALEFTP